MITGKSHKRRRLAELAIQSFRAQSHRNIAELLALNTDPSDWFKDDDIGGRLIELHADPELTLGKLRNTAIDKAKGAYIMQWDDDDYHGQNRIARQFEPIRTGRAKATILVNELFHFLDTNETRMASAANWVHGGFPGTIIHPINVTARYPDKRLGEDSEFLDELAREIDIKAIDNDPCDYVRIIHEANTWDRKHFRDIVAQNSRPATLSEEAYVQRITNQIANDDR